MMLFGTPLDAESSACAPLMWMTGNAGLVSLTLAATSPSRHSTLEADLGDERLVFHVARAEGFPSGGPLRASALSAPHSL